MASRRFSKEIRSSLLVMMAMVMVGIMVVMMVVIIYGDVNDHDVFR